MSESKETSPSAAKSDLTPEQVAALQLVTIAPAPRTIKELAESYAGQQTANLWPDQSVSQVESRIKELVKGPLLKYGDEAPDGEKTVELTAAATD
jgi:hypothetical protein